MENGQMTPCLEPEEVSPEDFMTLWLKDEALLALKFSQNEEDDLTVMDSAYWEQLD